MKPRDYLVTVFSEDQQGLIAAISRALFELNINLGDASYNVLGQGGKFIALCNAPADTDAEAILQALQATEILKQASIQVEPFDLATRHQSSGQTLRVAFTGEDMPGLVAQITELAQDFDANIEHMQTRSQPGAQSQHYRIELTLDAPENRRNPLLAALQNIASSLGLQFEGPIMEVAA